MTRGMSKLLTEARFDKLIISPEIHTVVSVKNKPGLFANFVGVNAAGLTDPDIFIHI